MSAAAARRTLAEAGRDLLEASGGSGRRRAAAMLDQSAADPASFADISSAPDWLRLGSEDRKVLARRAALLSMAPTLASSIDGTWLGTLAQTCGEEEVDRVIAAAEVGLGEISPCAADALEARGLALLNRALRPPLRRFVPADIEAAPVPDEDAAALVARALELAR